MTMPKITALLQKTWQIYSQNIVTILLVTIIVYLPINVYLSFFANINMDDLESWLNMMRLSGIYELLLGSFALIFYIKIAKHGMDGGRIKFGELWSKYLSWADYGRIVWTSLVKNLIVGLLYILLIIPGLVMSVFWLFAETIAVLEGTGGWRAMAQAKQTVKGNWWKVFWRIVACLLLVFVVGIGLTVSEAILPYAWISLATNAVSDLAAAFLAIYIAVMYLSIKTDH